MAVVVESVSVEQVTLAAGKQLAKFVGDVKAALKAGSTVQEVLAITNAALTDLLPLIGEVPALKLEAGENLWAEVNTIALSGIAVAKALVS